MAAVETHAADDGGGSPLRALGIEGGAQRCKKVQEISLCDLLRALCSSKMGHREEERNALGEI